MEEKGEKEGTHAAGDRGRHLTLCENMARVKEKAQALGRTHRHRITAAPDMYTAVDACLPLAGTAAVRRIADSLRF